jgi:hypothetical protein
MVSSEEGHFCSNSLKNEIARCGVWHIASYYLYRRRNQSDHLRPTPGIMHGVLSTSASSPSKPHDTPLTASGDQAHSSVALIRLVWRGNQACEPSYP